MRVYTVGHGTRSSDELLAIVRAPGVQTLVDVRRFPGSRRNPQFNQPELAATMEAAGVAYVHARELGGRLAGQPGEERFGCIRVAAFRRYAARMATAEWQRALEAALAQPTPCFMCAETPWWKCHRRLIAEQLAARGIDVVHLVGPERAEPHRPWEHAEYRAGKLYLCGCLVA